MLNKTVAT